jgi:hypothetical protein
MFAVRLQETAKNAGYYLFIAAGVEFLAGIAALVLIVDREKRENGYAIRGYHY